MRAPSAGWQLTLRTWLSVLALGLILWLIIRHTGLIFEVLAVLFGAYLMSVAVSPVADRLERWRVPRAVTVIAFYIVAIGLLVLLARLLFPVIQTEVRHLRRTGPAMLDRALIVLRNTPILQDWLPADRTFVQGLVQSADSFVRPAFGAVVNAGGLIVDVLVALVLGFFFVTDQAIGDRLLYGWIPGPQQARARRLSGKMRHRLIRWIWAQAAVASYFAIAFSLVLTLLHVPFAITIGITGGLLELIPYVGGFTAFVLAVLSALSVNPVLVLWIAVLYVIVIQIEGHVLAPALYGRATGLHPAVVLLAIFIGGKAAGLPGILFAVPTAVVVITLLEEAQRMRRESVRALPAPASATASETSEPEALEPDFGQEVELEKL